jgi:membrane fusion protein, multidrug efflux system
VVDRTRARTDQEELEQRPGIAQGDEAREQWPEEAEEASRKQRARSFFRQHPHAIWILLLVLIAVVAGGIYVWHYYSIRESTDDAQIDGHIGPVSSRVSGTVIQVNVEDNQIVEAGTVLVQLDQKDYQVALARAQADLADAEAAARAAQTGVPITSTTTTSQTSTADANLNAAQKEVDAANARLREAQANYNKVSQDLKRYAQLLTKDEISRQQYDAAVASEQSATASVDAARAAVASAQSHVRQAEAGVHAAQTGPQQVTATQARAAAAAAAVQTKRAAVEQAQLNLTYTRIVAPFAGIVSKRNVEPGQVIQAGQPMVSIVNLDDIWVTANFKETQLGVMRPGQTVKLVVDAYPDHPFRGVVDGLAGGTGARFSMLPPENATGNFVKVVQRLPVKIVLPAGQRDPGRPLRPGMNVVATVDTGTGAADSKPAP